MDRDRGDGRFQRRFIDLEEERGAGKRKLPVLRPGRDGADGEQKDDKRRAYNGVLLNPPGGTLEEAGSLGDDGENRRKECEDENRCEGGVAGNIVVHALPIVRKTRALWSIEARIVAFVTDSKSRNAGAGESGMATVPPMAGRAEAKARRRRVLRASMAGLVVVEDSPPWYQTPPGRASRVHGADTLPLLSPRHPDGASAVALGAVVFSGFIA